MLIWAAPLGLDWPPFLSSFSNNGDVLVPRNLIFLDYLHWPCFLIIYRLCCLVAIYYMWKARNCLRFQNRSLPFQHAKNLINSHLSFFGVVSPRSGDTSWPINRNLHLFYAKRPSSSIISVFWHSTRGKSSLD